MSDAARVEIARTRAVYVLGRLAAQVAKRLARPTSPVSP
jgi:ribosomal protein L13